MSLAAAHRFIAATRVDAELRASIAALGDDPVLADLIWIATAAGFALDEAALRAAFAQDYALAALAKGSPAGKR